MENLNANLYDTLKEELLCYKSKGIDWDNKLPTNYKIIPEKLKGIKFQAINETKK